MSSSEIGFNYASAFIEALQTPEEILRGGEELEAFAAVVQKLPPLGRVLAHPGFPLEKRLAVLEDVLGRIGAGPKCRRLLRLVVEKGRMAHFREIHAAFVTMRDARLNVESAEVVTAVPVTAAEKAQWEAALARMTGRNVRVSYRTDETLLGGALTRIGSVVYDGTLKKQLTRIRGVLLGQEAQQGEGR